LRRGAQADEAEFDSKLALYNSTWDSNDYSKHECGATCGGDPTYGPEESLYDFCDKMQGYLTSKCLDDCSALSSDKREALNLVLAECGLGTPRIPHIRPTHTFLIEV
jgi:hypothetical protein